MGRQTGVRIFEVIDTKQDDKVVFTGTPEEISSKLGINFHYVYNLSNSQKVLLKRYKIRDTGKVNAPKSHVFKVVDTTDDNKVVFKGTTEEIKTYYKIATSYVYRLCNEKKLLRKRYRIIKL